MKLAEVPTLLQQALAAQADDIVDLPVTSSKAAYGSFSQDVGFPDATERALDDGGVAVKRSDMNSVFNLLSKICRAYQAGVIPQWSNQDANILGGYSQNALVLGPDGFLYYSLKDDNMDPPPSDNWEAVGKGTKIDLTPYVEKADLTGILEGYYDKHNIDVRFDNYYDKDVANAKYVASQYHNDFASNALTFGKNNKSPTLYDADGNAYELAYMDAKGSPIKVRDVVYGIAPQGKDDQKQSILHFYVSSVNGPTIVTNDMEYIGLTTQGDLTTAIANFVNTATLSQILKAYVTSQQLRTMLYNYVTELQLKNTLNDYVDNKALQKALQAYSSTAQIQKTLDNYALAANVVQPGDLDDYVKKIDLNGRLSKYWTSQDVTDYIQNNILPVVEGNVTNALADYVTNKSLADTLKPYALKSDIPSEPDLSGFETKQDLKERLANYALKNEIPTLPDMTKYALESDLTNVSNQVSSNTSLAQKAENTANNHYTALNKELNNYVSQKALTNSLGNYALKSDIPTIPDMSQYETVADLKTRLGGYATVGQLPHMDDYLTNNWGSDQRSQAITMGAGGNPTIYDDNGTGHTLAMANQLPSDSQLAGYETKSDFQSTIANYPTSQQVEQMLVPYAHVDTQIASLSGNFPSSRVTGLADNNDVETNIANYLTNNHYATTNTSLSSFSGDIDASRITNLPQLPDLTNYAKNNQQLSSFAGDLPVSRIIGPIKPSEPFSITNGNGGDTAGSLNVGSQGTYEWQAGIAGYCGTFDGEYQGSIRLWPESPNGPWDLAANGKIYYNGQEYVAKSQSRGPYFYFHYYNTTTDDGNNAVLYVPGLFVIYQSGYAPYFGAPITSNLKIMYAEGDGMADGSQTGNNPTANGRYTDYADLTTWHVGWTAETKAYTNITVADLSSNTVYKINWEAPDIIIEVLSESLYLDPLEGYNMVSDPSNTAPA